jgi:prolyl-tRNA editing enzyme YbaK/EbsC (Cys-tRNA(Pro) deacylase)
MPNDEGGMRNVGKSGDPEGVGPHLSIPPSATHCITGNGCPGIPHSTPLDFADFLRTADLDAEIVVSGVEMPTVESAAAAMRVAPKQIFKSLLFQARDGRCVLVIACGTGRVDPKRVEERSGLTGIKLARPDVVLAKTGYRAGGTPPIGHREPSPVIVDTRVADQPWGYAGGGRPELLVKIRPADILRLTGGVVADVASPAPSAANEPSGRPHSPVPPVAERGQGGFR